MNKGLQAALIRICTSGGDHCHCCQCWNLPPIPHCAHIHCWPPSVFSKHQGMSVVPFFLHGGIQFHPWLHPHSHVRCHSIRLALCCHLSHGNNMQRGIGEKVQPMLPSHQDSPLTLWANITTQEALLSEQPSYVLERTKTIYMVEHVFHAPSWLRRSSMLGKKGRCTWKMETVYQRGLSNLANVTACLLSVITAVPLNICIYTGLHDATISQHRSRTPRLCSHWNCFGVKNPPCLSKAISAQVFSQLLAMHFVAIFHNILDNYRLCH